jgi:hypothetical protein
MYYERKTAKELGLKVGDTFRLGRIVGSAEWLDNRHHCLLE